MLAINYQFQDRLIIQPVLCVGLEIIFRYVTVKVEVWRCSNIK